MEHVQFCSCSAISRPSKHKPLLAEKGEALLNQAAHISPLLAIEPLDVLDMILIYSPCLAIEYLEDCIYLVTSYLIKVSNRAFLKRLKMSYQ